MLRINTNLYPSNGYYFVESDGSRQRAGNWRAVIKKVTEYRTRARLPLGDVEREVMAQACSRNPALCYDDRAVQAPRAIVTVKTRVLKWLFALNAAQAKERLNYVPAAEAASRAAICAGCPKNTPLGVSTCAVCKATLAEYRKQLLGMGRSRDARLGGCDALGCDLVTAIYMDEVRVDNPALPPHCWRKKTL